MKKLLKLSVVVLLSMVVMLSGQSGVEASTSGTQIVNFAKKFTGVPYKWGGTTPSGFDCSGFLTYVFSNHGISLPRTSADQFYQGEKISDSELQAGDLVFFTTYKAGPSHSGIYVGDNEFIHASDSGVVVSNLNNTYYKTRYLGARSFIDHEEEYNAAPPSYSYVVINKPINLWKRNSDNSLEFSRILYPGSKYRVYGYDSLYGGQYSVGGGYYITNMPTHISLY
ncbi:C40 family peptidase [Rossellomorea aquimaris]|uniref:C40 family peptidase n=1 Tax=Rossellomorea aquimaris TaxID=189382 RepID=UPI0007D089A4|nr:C40 family peptidase [Rossellomorea aquimaris]